MANQAREEGSQGLSPRQVVVRFLVAVLVTGATFIATLHFSAELGCLVLLLSAVVLAVSLLFLFVVPSNARARRRYYADVMRYREEFGPHFMENDL